MIAVSYVVAIVITLYWGVWSLNQVIQKGVRRSILGLVIVMLGLSLTGLLQVFAVDDAPNLERWLWYWQCMFSNLMSLCIVIMASVTGKPVNKDYMTKWEIALISLHLVVNALVLTNDWHGLINLDRYMYGFVNRTNSFSWLFSLAFILESGEMLFGIGWMFLKAHRDKILNNRMLMPLVLLLGVYFYHIFALHGGLIWGAIPAHVIYILLVMALVGACLRTGLLSANIRYEEFFEASNSGLEIFDAEGSKIYASNNSFVANPDDYELIKKNINGGSVHWYRDISSLKRKQRELEQTLLAQERIYNMCKSQEKVQQQVVDYELREKLYRELERILTCKKPLVTKYLNLLQVPSELAETASSINRLNVLVCYLKKRCVLFLSGAENSVIEAGNIYLAMSESKKYMAYEELDCLFQFELKGSLPLKCGLLLYDFFEEFLEGYIINGGLDVVARVYETQDTYELSFVVDCFEPWMEPWLEYEKEYLNIDSEIKCKDLGYAFNLTLCLPKEEVKA